MSFELPCAPLLATESCSGGHNIIGTSFLLFPIDDIFLFHDTLEIGARLNHFR